MKKQISKNSGAVFGGIGVSVLIVVLALLIPFLFVFFIVLAYRVLPYNVATVVTILAGLLFIGMVAISKIYSGGGSVKKLFKEKTDSTDS